MSAIASKSPAIKHCASCGKILRIGASAEDMKVEEPCVECKPHWTAMTAAYADMSAAKEKLHAAVHALDAIRDQRAKDWRDMARYN